MKTPYSRRLNYGAIKSNSLLYEAVAAPCTSLVQSSAGTKVKVLLDIPAAPHTTWHPIPRLPYIVEILASFLVLLYRPVFWVTCYVRRMFSKTLRVVLVLLLF